MPNTPCSIGQGVNVWCATHDVGVAEQEKMASMLSRMGEEIFVADEKFLDMVCVSFLNFFFFWIYLFLYTLEYFFFFLSLLPSK